MSKITFTVQTTFCGEGDPAYVFPSNVQEGAIYCGHPTIDGQFVVFYKLPGEGGYIHMDLDFYTETKDDYSPLPDKQVLVDLAETSREVCLPLIQKVREIRPEESTIGIVLDFDENSMRQEAFAVSVDEESPVLTLADFLTPEILNAAIAREIEKIIEERRNRRTAGTAAVSEAYRSGLDENGK